MKDGGPIRELAVAEAARPLDLELTFDEPIILRKRADDWLQNSWAPDDIVALNPGRIVKLWAINGDEPLPVARFEVPIETYAEYVTGGSVELLHDEAQRRQGAAECDRDDLHYYAGSIPLAELSEATRGRLRLDVLPHLHAGGWGQDTQENLWFGPRRGAVGLHWDGRLGYVIQLDGTKAVTVLHPEERQWLYPEPTWTGPNSRVNPVAVDLDQFPRARHATVRTAELEPGDVLVLPAGWWHHLTSTTPCASSVNVWLTLDPESR